MKKRKFGRKRISMLLDEFDKETNAMINPDMVTEKIEGYGKEYSTLLSKIEF